MSLLNYTTSVPASRTINQVHNLLVESGARQIMTSYDDDGKPIGVTFMIATADGNRMFELPAEVRSVLKVMMNDDRMQNSFKTPQQAERVGWRIIKDWLEAQLAIIETEMVTFEQVMLPYMKSVEGVTVFELYRRGTLLQPALEAGS